MKLHDRYNFETPQPTTLTENGRQLAVRVLNLGHDDKKIAAIKVIFDATGAGLLASKNCYDAAVDTEEVCGYQAAVDFLEGALFGLREQATNPGLRDAARRAKAAQ